MSQDHNWENYLNALRELPEALWWLFVYLLCRINFVLQRVPEKHSFKIASAPSTASDTIHTLVDYRNPYSKYTYTVFCGIVVGLVLMLF